VQCLVALRHDPGIASVLQRVAVVEMLCSVL